MTEQQKRAAIASLLAMRRLLRDITAQVDSAISKFATDHEAAFAAAMFSEYLRVSSSPSAEWASVLARVSDQYERQQRELAELSDRLDRETRQ